MRSYFYKAQSITWAAGNPTTPVRLDFLPNKGRRRQRQIIRRIHMFADVVITTPAATTIDGQDFCDIFKLIQLYDAEGDRRYLTGNEARLKMHNDMGINVPPDASDQAAATGPSTKVVHLILNFELPRRARRGEDYGMPVDDLLNGGGLNVTLGDVGDIRKTGAGALTIGATTAVRIVVECREEHDLRYPVRDIVRGYTFSSNTEFYVPVSNKLVREVGVFVVAAGGNTVITGTPDVTCEPYNLAAIRHEAFRGAYLAENDDVVQKIGTAGFLQGPVLNYQYWPIVWSGAQGKIPDMKLIGGNLLFRFSTAAAYSFLTHYIAPRSRALTEAAARRHGYSQVQAEIATANKGGKGKSPAEWAAWSRFMPAKQVNSNTGGNGSED